MNWLWHALIRDNQASAAWWVLQMSVFIVVAVQFCLDGVWWILFVLPFGCLAGCHMIRALQKWRFI